MREIKFRAWDKTTESMYQNVIVACGGDYVILEYNLDGSDDIEQTHTHFDNTDGDVVIMQFTGLKDKHGKEIYEGDILASNTGRKGEVVFKDGCFCWGNDGLPVTAQDDLEAAANVNELFIGSDWAEVIGNIYENPELLA